MAEENGEKFKETQAEAKKKGLTLNIDNQRFEELARENERLKVEMENKDGNLANADAQEAQKIFADMKERMAIAYEKQGIPFDSSQIRTMDDIKSHAEILQKLQNSTQTRKESPSGSAPLNSAQMGEIEKTGSYSSVEDLVNDLRDKAEVFKGTSQGNQAEAILNELFKKGLQGQKENQQIFKQYSKPMPQLVEKYGLKIPANKDDGDLQEFNKAFRRRKKLEREKGVTA